MCAQKAAKTNDIAQGSIVEKLTRKNFDAELPQRNLDKASFAIYIRQLLQNWRQGTVACKGRSDVSYANRKPWKQKGTGRARAGSARSPLWRGGGIIHGPQKRVRTLKTSKQLRSGVLNTLFWNYLEQGKIAYLDWTLTHDTPKTSHAYKALQSAKLLDHKIAIFLSPDDAAHYSSFANIKNVKVLFFDEANAYSVASNDRLIFLKKDFDAFKEMVAKWL